MTDQTPASPYTEALAAERKRLFGALLPCLVVLALALAAVVIDPLLATCVLLSGALPWLVGPSRVRSALLVAVTLVGSFGLVTIGLYLVGDNGKAWGLPLLAWLVVRLAVERAKGNGRKPAAKPVKPSIPRKR